jgi:hypothetical protein
MTQIGHVAAVALASLGNLRLAVMTGEAPFNTARGSGVARHLTSLAAVALIALTWLSLLVLRATGANPHIWEITAITMFALAAGASALAVIALLIERPRLPAVVALALSAAFTVAFGLGSRHCRPVPSTDWVAAACKCRLRLRRRSRAPMRAGEHRGVDSCQLKNRRRRLFRSGA